MMRLMVTDKNYGRRIEQVPHGAVYVLDRSSATYFRVATLWYRIYLSLSMKWRKCWPETLLALLALALGFWPSNESSASAAFVTAWPTQRKLVSRCAILASYPQVDPD